MRATTASRMQVVKKEEKEGKIKDLIKRDIERRSQGNAGDSEPTYLLIARSAESPVAKAIESLAPDLRAAGIHILAVLLSDTSAAPAALSGLALAGQGLRCLNDVRYLEAHEQLVLGSSTVWIGDCMRRDPSRRDAYECHADDAEPIAACARTSFFRMWRSARPMGADVPAAAARIPAVPPGAVNPHDPTAPLVASTRH